MRNILAIAKKDFKTYFTTPIAYIFIAVFLGVMGFMFFMTLSGYMTQTLRMAQQGGQAVSLLDGVLMPTYGNMNVIILFMFPFLTMRLMAEEKKNQTIYLLMTSPVKLSEIIIGKFLSAAGVLAVALGMTLVYPMTLYFTGNLEILPTLASILGTFLLGCCYISVGLLFSSMTENQIIAAVCTFMTLMFLWLISWASYTAGPFWGEVFRHLSLIEHFKQFGRGIINTTDVVYYLSVIFMGLFLSVKVLDSYRWRT